MATRHERKHELLWQPDTDADTSWYGDQSPNMKGDMEIYSESNSRLKPPSLATATILSLARLLATSYPVQRNRINNRQTNKQTHKQHPNKQTTNKQTPKQTRKQANKQTTNLLIGLVTRLHPALVQGVVVVEEEEHEVPQDASVEQLVLEPVVHRKRRHCLRRYTVETWEVLGAGQGEDERAVQRREEGRGAWYRRRKRWREGNSQCRGREDRCGIGGERDGGRVTASAEGEGNRGGVGEQGGEGQREGTVVGERTQW